MTMNWVTKRRLVSVLTGMVVIVFSAACGTATTPGTSSFVPMALYESAQYPLSIQYPAEWTEHPKIQSDWMPVWRTNSEREWFVVVQDTVPQGESLSSYVDWVISRDKQSDKQHEIVSREQTKTTQGLPAELVEYTISWGGEPMTVNALIYLHDNGFGVRTAYGVYTSRYEEMKDMIAYSFSTFHFDSRYLDNLQTR